MKKESMKVRLTFTEELLGTASANPDLYKSYIASNAPDAKTMSEEVEDLGVDAVVEKGMTVFPKEEGRPFLYDYQIKGFFKNACSALRKVPKTESSKIKAYKKEIDNLIFIDERKIFLNLPKPLSVCQRPLRAQTMQGERVALAISDAAPAGTTIEFTVTVLVDSLIAPVMEWLDYGVLNGIGQWHNSGKGRFTWEAVD